MKKYRTNARREAQYNKMLELAYDKKSSLYNLDGTHNRAASHRAAFWNGYEHGTKYPHLVPEKRNLMYCVWRAGVDFASEVKA